MGYVRGFDNDIFISYAHIDNQPLIEGQQGWVANFHQSLAIRLQQLLGSKLEIWRDPYLTGHEYISDTIVMQLPHVAVLVLILSPLYVRSEWCIRELREFCQVSVQTGGLRIEDKSRIFKVVKTHLPHQDQPPELQGMLGYEFYEIDRTTGRPREFRQEAGPNADRNYWAKLEDLAFDLSQLLIRMGKHYETSGAQEVATSGHTTGGSTIYLAETTSDLSTERDKIKRELERRGHEVLPDKPLPLKVPDFHTAVRAYLDRCQLSIHLIGANYGIIPEAAHRSIVDLQQAIAAEHSKDHPFLHCIWMPIDLQGSEERQKQFIKYLQYEVGVQPGVEILQTTLEDLKTFIQDKLSALRQPAPVSVSDDAPRRIYVLCDQQDLDDLTPLEDYLYEQGFEVTLPAMEGAPDQIREDHKANLLECDGLIIYYGKANELWLRTALRDSQKIVGYGRSTPLRAKAIYVSAPETQSKQRFRTREALVIKQFGPFSPAALQPFLTHLALRSGRQL
jgi:hypothetical protein